MPQTGPGFAVLTGWWYMFDTDRILYRQAAVITAEECGPDNLARADALTGRVVRALVEAGGAGIDPVPLMVNVEFSAAPCAGQSVEARVEKNTADRVHAVPARCPDR